tara:strand:+ start:744 stop:1340 length:597 start_codon:yes stop_codon:yes gene_type:complete
MIKIIVVGDIGSGKSYVSNLFGYPVFNADKEVGNLYRKNKLFFKKIKKIFPKYISIFPLKKDELANIINKNVGNLKKITRAVHPIIRKKMNNFLTKHRNKKFVVLDIPLYLENKLNTQKDIIVFIDSKKSKILIKLKKRKNFNPRLLKKFKDLQLPLKYKRTKSKYVLKNNFITSSAKKEVKLIKKDILKNERSSTRH